MGVSEIGSGGQISERMTRFQVPTGVDVEIDVEACNAVPDGTKPAAGMYWQLSEPLAKIAG